VVAGGRGAGVVAGARGAWVGTWVVAGGGAMVRAGVGGARAVVDGLALGDATAGGTGCALGLDAMLLVGWPEAGESATLGAAVPVPPLALGWLVRPPTMLIATNRATAQIAQLAPTRRVGWVRRNTIPRFQSDLGLSGGGGGGGRTGGGKDTDPPNDLHDVFGGVVEQACRGPGPFGL
jgi:hypothetical protein